jgi:hypothetical protein
MNFTRSTFVLDATAESREPPSALDRKRPDEAVRQDASRQAAAAPPPAPAAAPLTGNKPVHVEGAKPKVTPPAAEVFIPEAPAELRHEQPPPLVTASRLSETSPTAALALPRAIAPGTATPPAAAPTADAPVPMTPATVSVSPAPMAPAAVQPTRTADANGKTLIERAERLIRIGDISGARLVLERAVDRGEPRAMFLLAQTCDPRMLRAWNVQGLRPDPERARALYARAAQEGLREAKPLADAMR